MAFTMQCKLIQSFLFLAAEVFFFVSKALLVTVLMVSWTGSNRSLEIEHRFHIFFLIFPRKSPWIDGIHDTHRVLSGLEEIHCVIRKEEPTY